MQKYKEQSEKSYWMRSWRVKLIARKTKPFRQLNAYHLPNAPNTGSIPGKVTWRLDQMIIKTYLSLYLWLIVIL